VLLLDEIEKAHSDIYNLLLQIMDYGRLTDNNGRSTDFRNVILIMTSNVGAEDLEKRAVGFTGSVEDKDSSAAIQQEFSPEFRNRLDRIIQFNHLTTEVVRKVVDKFLTQVEVQLEGKGVELEVDQSGREWLAENGYDLHMGARPMERLIQDQIKQPLASELLFGRLAKGGKVVISASDGELSFDYQDRQVERTSQS
jgi:ATP-dependent Clp protease ATP-binding subunit ClpA